MKNFTRERECNLESLLQSGADDLEVVVDLAWWATEN